MFFTTRSAKNDQGLDGRPNCGTIHDILKFATSCNRTAVPAVEALMPRDLRSRRVRATRRRRRRPFDQVEEEEREAPICGGDDDHPRQP